MRPAIKDLITFIKRSSINEYLAEACKNYVHYGARFDQGHALWVLESIVKLFKPNDFVLIWCEPDTFLWFIDMLHGKFMGSLVKLYKEKFSAVEFWYSERHIFLVCDGRITDGKSVVLDLKYVGDLSKRILIER